MTRIEELRKQVAEAQELYKKAADEHERKLQDIYETIENIKEEGNPDAQTKAD